MAIRRCPSFGHGAPLGADCEHIRSDVEIQTLSTAEGRCGRLGSSLNYLLDKCRLGRVLEGVGRDGSARAEVGYHVHIRVVMVLTCRHAAQGSGFDGNLMLIGAFV